MSVIKYKDPSTGEWVAIPGGCGSGGEPGKSAYEFAKEAGYTGTEEEFGEKLAEEPLIGTTAEITPTQVAFAISTGRAVTLIHTDSMYGEMAASNFTYSAGVNSVFSTTVLETGGTRFAAVIAGHLGNNNWSFNAFTLATTDDIPTALRNPNALTFTGAATGTYDGSAAKTVNIPTVPASLKNPYALTINGTAYDGSQEVSMTIEGGGDGIPDYIKTEADRVAKVVQSRQNANTITFLACSDIHYYSPDNATANANAEKMEEAVVSMGQAMGLIRERCHIDFAVMLGDMTWDSGETHDEILAEMRFVNACLHEGFGHLPQFRMEGNHDDAYESGGDLTTGEIFANIGAWNSGAVYSDREAGYCYRDFDSVKLRVICLNSSQYSGSGFLTDADQVAWLAEALNLSEKGAGWRSIILSHHPLEWDKAGGVNPIATVNAASGLIASFHGHIHNFLTGTVTGTELPRISIPNAGYSRENQYSAWKEGTTYSKTPGTATNTSFCVITIDTAAKKIYADHYGAGYDRVIEYVDNAPASYTNLVPTSLDPSTREVFNGTGYMNGVYASSSGTNTDAECVTTGIILYGEQRTTPIYIKGAEVDTSKSHCRILGFDASFGVSFQAAEGTSIPTYFTVETLGTQYYRLTPTDALTNAAGGTDYLRFSLIGSGENLIITINEPIE